MTTHSESGTVQVDIIPGKAPAMALDASINGRRFGAATQDRTRVTVLKNFGDTARRIYCGSFFGAPARGLEQLEDSATGTVTFREVQGRNGVYLKPIHFQPQTLPEFRPATMAGYITAEERVARNGNRYAASIICPDNDAPAIELSGVFDEDLIEKLLESDPLRPYILEYVEDNGWLQPLDIIPVK